jgi:hypothetical protein
VFSKIKKISEIHKKLIDSLPKREKIVTKAEDETLNIKNFA